MANNQTTNITPNKDGVITVPNAPQVRASQQAEKASMAFEAGFIAIPASETTGANIQNVQILGCLFGVPALGYAGGKRVSELTQTELASYVTDQRKSLTEQAGDNPDARTLVDRAFNAIDRNIKAGNPVTGIPTHLSNNACKFKVSFDTTDANNVKTSRVGSITSWVELPENGKISKLVLDFGREFTPVTGQYAATDDKEATPLRSVRIVAAL